MMLRISMIVLWIRLNTLKDLFWSSGRFRLCSNSSSPPLYVIYYVAVSSSTKVKTTVDLSYAACQVRVLPRTLLELAKTCGRSSARNLKIDSPIYSHGIQSRSDIEGGMSAASFEVPSSIRDYSATHPTYIIQHPNHTQFFGLERRPWRETNLRQTPHSWRRWLLQQPPW